MQVINIYKHFLAIVFCNNGIGKFTYLEFLSNWRLCPLLTPPYTEQSTTRWPQGCSISKQTVKPISSVKWDKINGMSPSYIQEIPDPSPQKVKNRYIRNAFGIFLIDNFVNPQPPPQDLLAVNNSFIIEDIRTPIFCSYG